MRLIRWLARAAAASVTLLVSATAFAQSCALCYNNAAAAKASGIRALQHGIILLLIPPMLIFIGILVTAFRRRNQFNELPLPVAGHDRVWDERLPMLPAATHSRLETERVEYRYPAP